MLSWRKVTPFVLCRILAKKAGSKYISKCAVCLYETSYRFLRQHNVVRKEHWSRFSSLKVNGGKWTKKAQMENMLSGGLEGSS